MAASFLIKNYEIVPLSDKIVQYRAIVRYFPAEKIFITWLSAIIMLNVPTQSINYLMMPVCS
jgi:hypothetical protein